MRRLQFWHLPVIGAVAAVVVALNGYVELSSAMFLLSIAIAPLLFGIGLLVAPMPWDDDGFATKGQREQRVDDAEALRVARREGRIIWKGMQREERHAALLLLLLFALTLGGTAVADPGMLFLVVFATAMLFALSCHSYRLEVLVGRRRERALSRTALRALRVIAFTTAIVLGIVVADHAFGISRWSEEILAVTKGWVVVAWLVAIAVQRPRVSSRP